MVVVFEDIPAAYHLPALKRRLPPGRFVLRSHNIGGEIFEGFDKEGGIATRLAWKTELEKLRKFEYSILSYVDAVWAISSRDSAEYRRRYGKICDGILGVRVNPDPYRNVPIGDLRTVVYVGSADLRKGHGLIKFIQGVWKSIVQEDSSARLVLAGRYTDRFGSPAQNIEGRGYVENDADVLSEGAICINPQIRGSGIKLKSIIAMLAGKVLISTSKGLEGIEGVHGTHFFRVHDIGEMQPLVTYLMNHKGKAVEVGRRARQLALSLNREEEFGMNVRPLLTKLRGSVMSPAS
ncbi:MAG: glycosyltransferase [Fidelibacterota bacterium]